MSKSRRHNRFNFNRPLRPNALLMDLRPDLAGSTEAQITELVLTLRRRGASIADIADTVYPEQRSAQTRIHQILDSAPRRLRFGPDVMPLAGPPVGFGGEP